MKRSLLFSLLLALLCIQPLHSREKAEAVTVRVLADGGLGIGDATLQIQAFAPGWKQIRLSTVWDEAQRSEAMFTIGKGKDATMQGSARWKQGKDGSLEGIFELECLRDTRMQCISPTYKSPVTPVLGHSWEADKSGGTIPVEPASTLGNGTAGSLRLPLTGGAVLEISFPEPTSYRAQDGRRWGDYWFIRLGGNQTLRDYHKGDRITFRMKVSAGSVIDFHPFSACEIHASNDWIPLRNQADVLVGSALDFSVLGLQDAPAGKHGWLKAVDGHFEFEGRPGVPVRFYGTNLCFTANYPDHEFADILADRLTKLGYNALRLHHHDRDWVVPENAERLDYFLAALLKRGIYITTDLYVSRPVRWKDLGVERKGIMDKNLFKALVGCNDLAFENWCAFTAAFLNHVNPYTGRALKDEPGIPFISIINEGKLAMHWMDSGKAASEDLLRAWHEYGGSGPLPKANTDEFRAFSAWFNRRLFERCSGFVRSLGARALLTNDNNGSEHADGEDATPLYDYVDNHFYVDHPQFLDKRWRLPAQCGNSNPVFTGGPGLLNKGYASHSAKPYTITEWNFSGPGCYRGMGGVITGALASVQGWDGLWRFAFAHSRDDFDPAKARLSYFNCSTDPLMLASERASICLFLRGDAAEGGDAVSLDRKEGVMRIDTPRTCGLFLPKGKASAGILEAELAGAPATIWASSLDGAPLARSERILLTQLTDVQGEGTRYADETRSVLLRWGDGLLLERGSAQVSLRIDRPEACSVYALDLSGARRSKLKTSARGGCLSFELCTKGAEGARIHYEIVRER